MSNGRVFRSMNNRHELTGDVLLPQNIMEAVGRYGERIGVGKLAPHDLRRTFAKLAHTERYLGVRQDLQDASCDHLGIKLMSS